MSKFGAHIDKLFEHGGPVSFARVALANTIDLLQASGTEAATAKSKLEQLFEERRKDKFGTDKLEWTRESSRTPIDLDEINRPVPYSGRLEKQHGEQLRQKFNLPRGLELESRNEPKPVPFESIGSSAESIVQVKFAVQCGKVRW